MRYIILAILCIFLLAQSASAWTQRTHEIFAEEICYKFSECVNLECMGKIKTGSYYPIKTLHDYEGVNLYRDECVDATGEGWCDTNCQDCTQGDRFLDRTPLDRMEGYLAKAKTEFACEKFFNIGIAGFYYFETSEYWNMVKGEKSYCRDSFEDKVEVQLNSGRNTDWTVTYCGKDFYGEDFRRLVNDYVDLIEELAGVYSVRIIHPKAEETGNTSVVTEPEVKCVFEDVQYLNNLCKASKKVEDLGETQGVDSFNLLFVIVVILIIYMLLFRRKRFKR